MKQVAKSTSVESLLTRELDLRFIDARNLVADAKISLGIFGYPSKEDFDVLKEEAIQIFESRSLVEQAALRQVNLEFEEFKSLCASSSSSVGNSTLDSSVRSGSVATTISFSGRGSSRVKNAIRGFCNR